MRHDLLAIAVYDPRELRHPADRPRRRRRPGDRPAPRGAGHRRPCSAASPPPPPSRSTGRDLALRRAGAELLELATDGDWLAAIVRHVRRKRVQAVNAQVLRTIMIAMDFLNPGRLWWLLVVAALGGRVRRRPAVAAPGDAAVHRRSTCSTGSRPIGPGWRRHVVAGLQLLGLAAGVVAIARPIERATERTRERGPDRRAVRRVAVDDGRPTSTRAGWRPPSRRPATSSTRSTPTSRSG